MSKPIARACWAEIMWFQTLLLIWLSGMKSLSLLREKGMSLPGVAAKGTTAPVREAWDAAEGGSGQHRYKKMGNLSPIHPTEKGSVSKGSLVGEAEKAPALLVLGSWVIFSPLQCTHVVAWHFGFLWVGDSWPWNLLFYAFEAIQFVSKFTLIIYLATWFCLSPPLFFLKQYWCPLVVNLVEEH